MGNLTVEDYTQSGHGLMTQAQYAVTLQFIYIVCLVLALTGTVTNVINIRVFVVMGVNDGVIVSFLALAIFDLAYIISSLSLSVSMAFYVTELQFATKYHIDPLAIFVFSGHAMIIINITNVLTTTFLAVVRCLCVAKPLQFKNTITKKRSTLFMVAIAIFSVAIYTPMFGYMGMVNKFDKSSNTSRLSLWISPNREIVKNNIWMLIDFIIPIVTEFVILVCIVIMVRCLREASKFRQSSSNDIALVVEKGNIKHGFNQSNEVVLSDSNSVTDKLTGKDLRVVQQVVLISVVYIVCNVPKIVLSFCTAIEPEFTAKGRYSKVCLSVHCLRKLFEIGNAAVNLFIYYKYNRKFRSVLCP